MPTSQNFDTSNKYIKYKIEVTVNSQSIENNTSNITVKVWFFRTNQGYTTFGSGTCYCSINGTSYSQAVTSSQKITSSPIALFTKTVNIGHNNDGSKSIWVVAHISHNAPLTSSDQGFNAGLQKIPRAAVFTGADDFTDEQNPKIYFNNPAGFKLQLKMEAGSDDYLVVRDNLVNPNSPYTFELTADERNKLRAKTPNSNKLTVRFTVATYMPGSTTPGNHSYGDKTMSIVNANPVFSPSQLSYEDTNSNTLAVTNNNQLIVRNQSQLRASFASATAQKSASIAKYQIIFNGNSQDKTSAGSYDLGPVDSSSSLKLQLKAIDSRGNSTTVSKTIQILDWVLPIINSSAKRVNNYEDETKLKADVDISKVKNLNSLSSLQYRTKKVSDSAWGSWINFQNNTETTVILDKLFAWNLEIKASDKFGTSSQSLIVPKGMPILFFDTKKLSVGVNCFPEKIESFEISGKTIFDMVYPIGSIYMSVNSTNPGAIFGGTWESWGQGRVPVGVNTNDLDFNAVEKSGGNKNHAHILGDNAAAMIGSDEQAGNSIAYAATNGLITGVTRVNIGQRREVKIMARIVSLIDRAVLPLPKLKRVAAYARVSCGKDEMLHSLSAQVSYYSKMIQNHPGWEYVGVYSDKAYTGTKSARPDFERLLKDCKLGKIDMIITKSISRFARNTLDTLTITRELKNLGVDVFFERERIHSISPDGELMLTILASFAQEESLSVSENCKWQIRNKFKNGELANLRFLFGYEISKGEIKIDEENAAIVKWIFDQYTNGTGCTKIAKMLREYGVPNIRGGKWTADRVRNIILNEKYKGDALLQKKFVSDHLTKGVKRNHGELPMYYAEGTHEAIVEKEVFEKASEILEANRKKAKTNRQTPKKYIFTGKIKCLNCGKNYKRKVCKGKIYWICATYAEEGKNICNSKQISEEILMSKACEVLGINIFDEKLFAKNVKQILVPNHELLTFVLHDGNEVTLKWENRSRSESWSEEMRLKARERAINFLKEGK